MTWTSEPVKGHAQARRVGLTDGGYTLVRCECGEQGILVWSGDLAEWHREHRSAVQAAREKEKAEAAGITARPRADRRRPMTARHLRNAAIIGQREPVPEVKRDGSLADIYAPVAIAFTEDEVKALALFCSDTLAQIGDDLDETDRGAITAVISAADDIEEEGERGRHE